MRITDVRALLRLMHDVYKSADARLSKESLLAGLTRLVRAKAAAIAVMHLPRRSNAWQVASLIETGFDDPVRRRVLRSCFESDSSYPLLAILRHQRRVVTRRRRDIVNDGAWESSPQVLRIRQKLGLDDYLCSMHRLSEPGWVVCLGLWRGTDDRPFTPRDALLVHLLHNELSTLHERAPHEVRARDGVAALTGRMRQTLHLLLEGAGEKQVAERLGVSPHTVHVYVRNLYRHFHVNSRAELLSRVLPRPSRHH